MTTVIAEAERLYRQGLAQEPVAQGIVDFLNALSDKRSGSCGVCYGPGVRIAVIGAGPAGSRAAANLARAGHDVDLYDASFDREKPCGGGIPWRGLGLLSPRIGSPGVGADASANGGAVRSVAVRRVLFEAPSGAAAEVALDQPVAVYSRRELDRALVADAERAGARLVERRAVGLEQAGRSWRLTLGPRSSFAASVAAKEHPANAEPQFSGSTFAYDHVVGADGTKSFVRRAVGASPFSSADLSQAVGWYLTAGPSDIMTIRFDARIAGYLWAFPRADHVAIGACAPLAPGSAERLWGVARDFLESIRCREGLEQDRDGLDWASRWGADPIPYSALIPSLGPAALGSLRPSGPGWSLVGDAAGLVDPLTREGIAPGIRSADLLADAFASGDPASYGKRVRETLVPELAWAAARRDRFFDPALVERLVRYLGRSSAIRGVMADLIAGAQDYRTLKRRLVRAAVPAGLQLTFAKLGTRPPLGRRLDPN